MTNKEKAEKMGISVETYYRRLKGQKPRYAKYEELIEELKTRKMTYKEMRQFLGVKNKNSIRNFVTYASINSCYYEEMVILGTRNELNQDRYMIGWVEK